MDRVMNAFFRFPSDQISELQSKFDEETRAKNDRKEKGNEEEKRIERKRRKEKENHCVEKERE